MQNYHNDHPKREYAVRKLAELYKFEDEKQIRQLREMLAFTPYPVLIRPLAAHDRKREDSYQKIANRWGITVLKVRYFFIGA